MRNEQRQELPINSMLMVNKNAKKYVHRTQIVGFIVTGIAPIVAFGPVAMN